MTPRVTPYLLVQDLTISLQPLDWAVLVGYGVLLLLIGVVSARKKVHGADDYFLAGRSMPLWAVAISILSTAQSAATYVAVPALAYAGDLTYLSSNIGAVIGGVILATVFIPAYYRLSVATPYQLLESRFGPGAKLSASAAYMLGRVFASGARIYVGAIPAAIFLFGRLDPTDEQVIVTIAGFMVLGIVITFLGGISSVIWVDVLQVTVYLGAAVATIAVLLGKIPVGFTELFEGLAHPPGDAPSKLRVLEVGVDVSKPWLGLDWSKEFTLPTALVGFTLLTLASHGMDQDLVQRMLTCRSSAKGSWSVVSGVLVGIPAVLIFLTVGVLLSVFYTRPDLMGAAAPGYAAPAARDAFQTFAFKELPIGFAGLFVAGLFAVGPAGINSSLNAMASTLLSDLYRPLARGRSESHYLAVGRLGVVFWAVVLGAFAVLCIHWARESGQSLISFVLSVMSFAYAGLLGVFAAALFTRRGSTGSVVAALVTGFTVVLGFQTFFWAKLFGVLPALRPAGLLDLEAESLKNALPWLRFAFPWQLPIGAVVAFAVASSRRGRNAAAASEKKGTRAPDSEFPPVGASTKV